MTKLQEKLDYFYCFQLKCRHITNCCCCCCCAAVVVSITVTVVIFCVGKTYYLHTDGGYSTFVIHNLRDLHCHIISNCLLTTTVSYTVCIIFILCFNTKFLTSSFNGPLLICVKLKAELKFWMITIHIKF